MKEDCIRICLWSGPRNISTALMYAFAQRSDTRVFDEPLYAHYLSKTKARHYHPGADEVLATMENNGQKVVQELILGDHETPVVFFKNMAHHLVDLDWGFLESVVNVILTRDPQEVLPSFVKQVPQPALRDVGYEQQLALLNYLLARGHKPLVLDARKTLSDPRRMLTQLCARIGIPFEETMLSWQAGPRVEDGIWAKYWYHNLHRSTGFQPYQPKTASFPDYLQPLLAECQPYYEQLIELALAAR